MMIDVRVGVDEDLQADWRGVLAGLKILCDATEDGRRLTIVRSPAIGPAADPRLLIKAYVFRQIDAILSAAEVVT